MTQRTKGRAMNEWILSEVRWFPDRRSSAGLPQPNGWGEMYQLWVVSAGDPAGSRFDRRREESRRVQVNPPTEGEPQ